MIDTYQIRPGNIVLFKGKYHRWQENDFLDKDIRINGQYVALAPEILEKCGFERGEAWLEKYLILYIENNERKIGFLWDTTLEYWDNTTELLFPNIKHLHQLQNLYFSLTGNELTITL